MATKAKITKSTINEAEVEKFIRMSNEWWDQNGKFKPLHKFNPTRITYIRKQLIEHFGLDETAKEPLKKLNILDIGCGGGLLCEPLSRLGAKVTGIDAAAQNIKVAQTHADQSKLDITYSHIDVEEMAKKKTKYDVVLAMEVVEHVDNLDNFIAAAAQCLKKDGLMFIATINRTVKSYALAIIGAEYVLRWLPIGTHSWKKFLKPSEIYNIAADNALELKKLDGVEYNLLKDEWQLSENLDVNYVCVFEKR
ncbi:MAG: bifunctional 2-polyprenyl-6-hydroxyphenol methylase/3-demethylubiquinol 3-O-methyltransferase UbiG [Proteobacteria bacterium]|nr:bifunctional 2-polyprenyl-6-hydroxyphenol methylase/3-demethylubiquinol 3-O-methyltransferase UbiG [Pseudomonadota bacterium]